MDILTTKKTKAVAKPAKSTSSKPVVTTSSTTIEAFLDDNVSATAAVLLDSPSEYRSNSDEDWDVSCCEVSSPPLCGKHLIWNCQIHSLTDDFPVKTCAPS